MPTQIWNQGRVVGYSAYELYVKHHQSEDPSTPPASEREWLASTIAMGSSMLLQIPESLDHTDDENWVYEVQFPDNTRLCAANTIIASYFKGSAEYFNNWATRIIDYGDLISNTSNLSPQGDLTHDGDIPTKVDVNTTWTTEEKQRLAQYMKIVDGIILQPGTWRDGSPNKPPEKDFTPNLNDYPRLRILFKGPIDKSFQVLLTGLTIRTVVKGVTGLDSATNTNAPEDGDFLGPGQFPWAAKIMFNIPSSYVAYFSNGAYTRQLPSGSQDITVKDTSIIDMATTKPETYYETNYSNARILTNVAEYTTLGDGTAVLTIYQKKDKYPPALFGSFIDSNGENYLNPIDNVAPGSVKMFENATEEELKEYESTFDGTFAINKNTDKGTIEIIGPDDTLVPAAEVNVEDLTYNNIEDADIKSKGLHTKTGKLEGISLSMSNDTDGTQLLIGDDSPNVQTSGNTQYDVGILDKLSPNSSNIYWAVILEALANNKSIDVLGDAMKALKAGLPKNYIQFPNGLRLYISNTQPDDTDVPIGSIGIGWGFYNE